MLFKENNNQGDLQFNKKTWNILVWECLIWKSGTVKNWKIKKKKKNEI